MKSNINIKSKIFVLTVLIALIFLASVSVAGAEYIDVSFPGIKIYIDGTLKHPTMQPLIYKGTTYVPLRFISEALGKPVVWEGSTKSIYIGPKPGGYYLVDVLKPYSEGSSFGVDFVEVNKTIELGNEKFVKSIECSCTSNLWHYIVYNLNSQYSRLTLKVAAERNAKVQILGDDEILWEGEVSPSDLPVDLDLNVSGVNKLTMRGYSNFWLLSPKVY